MRSRLVYIGVNARTAVAATLARVRRTAAGPALVRLSSGVAAFAALALALPASEVLDAPLSVLLRVAASLFAIAVAVALAPRTRWVSLVALLAIGAWLVTTIGFGEEPTVARVALLGAALYLMHTGAALAAVLPYDCAVGPGVLLRWLRRVGAVLGLSLLVGAGGMAVAGQLPATPSVIGPIVGSVVAAGLAGLLAWHLRRRRE